MATVTDPGAGTEVNPSADIEADGVVAFSDEDVKHVDGVGKQAAGVVVGASSGGGCDVPAPVALDGDGCVTPRTPLWPLFKMFLSFGLRAWGGPVAQIAMIKDDLVLERKWISVTKFNRVLALYQVLPGPEATELCCYFGMITAGRIGSVVAGTGFVLPGFVLMLIFSWLYDEYGTTTAQVEASFKALKPVVVAVVFSATRRLAEHALQSPGGHGMDVQLLLLAFVCALWWILKVCVSL